MLLIYFVAFVVFKILFNLVSMQNLLNANNCWHKQNSENCPTWPHIHFQCTFKISYWFYLIFGSLDCRKCCLLVSHGFSRKRGGITMRNYMETCKGICSYNLGYNFFAFFLPSKSSLFVVHFSNAFWHGKEALPKHDS